MMHGVVPSSSIESDQPGAGYSQINSMDLGLKRLTAVISGESIDSEQPDAGPRLSFADAEGALIDVSQLTVMQTIRRIKHYAMLRQGFDIFQLTAFLHKNPKYGSYWMAVTKCVLALMTQVPALIYVNYEVTMKGLQIRGGWCPEQKSSNHLVLCYFGFCLSAFIAVRQYQLLHETHHSGMYCVQTSTFQNLPRCINGHWLFVGKSYSTICHMVCVWASLLVIFFSTAVFDMVINCLAISYLSQLSQFFVTAKDYKMMEQFFEDYGHHHEQDDASGPDLAEAKFSFHRLVHNLVKFLSVFYILAVLVAPIAIFFC